MMHASLTGQGTEGREGDKQFPGWVPLSLLRPSPSRTSSQVLCHPVDDVCRRRSIVANKISSSPLLLFLLLGRAKPTSWGGPHSGDFKIYIRYHNAPKTQESIPSPSHRTIRKSLSRSIVAFSRRTI